jgi:hypothetical protein
VEHSEPGPSAYPAAFNPAAFNPVAAWGEVRQLGYVVPAHTLAQHLEHWGRVMGLGPWLLVEHPPVTEFVHRGTPGELDFTIAIAHLGALQVELIAQHSDQPSTYLDFLDRNPDGGLHHVAWWPDDMDAAEALAASAGWELWSGGRIGPNGRFRYYVTESHPGTVIELAEVTGRRLEYFETQFAGWSRTYDPRSDELFVVRN